MSATTRLETIPLVYGLGVLLLTLLLVVRLLHARGPLSLIGNLRNAVSQFTACFALLILLLIALEFDQFL